MEDGALLLQLVPQLGGVGQVAVVADGHGALAVVDQHGLSVVAVQGAGGAVAAVAHGHLALVHLLQHVPGEHIRHQANILVAGDHAVVIHRDAAALLAAVLQGVQRVIGLGHHALAAAAVNAEHTTFFMQLVKH